MLAFLFVFVFKYVMTMLWDYTIKEKINMYSKHNISKWKIFLALLAYLFHEEKDLQKDNSVAFWSSVSYLEFVEFVS